MERKQTNHLKSILLSGLGFGIGGVIGNFALYFLVRSELLNWPLSLVPEGQDFILLLFVIVLLVLGIGLTTGLGGAVGGYILSTIDPIYPRRKYIWRSAIAMGLTEALLIIPLLLLTVILALYNNGLDREPTGYILVFSIFGILFGILFGLIIGFSTINWRQVWRVLLATIIGFGLGGAVIGYVIRLAYYPATLGEDLPDFMVILPIMSFAFFGIGGLFLGWVYEWVTHWRVDNVPDQPAKWVKVAGVLLGLLLAYFVLSNFRQLVKFLTIQPGSVSSQLEIDTAGVHWKDGYLLSNQLISSDLNGFSASASSTGDLGVAWAEDNEGISTIFLGTTKDDQDINTISSSKVQISITPGVDAKHPEVTTDEQGISHVVWVEESTDRSDILYRRCAGNTCNEPVVLSNAAESICEDYSPSNYNGDNDWPIVSMGSDNSVMVMWSNLDNFLFYSIWEDGQLPSGLPSGCLPIIKSTGTVDNQIKPRLSGSLNGEFDAVFSVNKSNEETVYQIHYAGQEWSDLQSIGSGKYPNIFSLPDGTTYYFWCDENDKVRVKDAETEMVDVIEFPQCSSRPTMAVAGTGEIHLVWYSNEIRNNLNIVFEDNVIYESIKVGRNWSEPAIVVQTIEPSLPIITGKGSGDLDLIWNENSSQRLNLARQPIYSCSVDDLGEIGKVMLETIEKGGYLESTARIPFCKNRYVGLIYMPNPEKEYSDQKPTENGGFDTVSDLASLVEYEVVLSVMEWAGDEDGQDLNPGSVYIKEIGNLYQQIKEDPSRYPRGLTVRILLGNYPELAKLEWGEQIWNVIEDLRNAGVEVMVDSNIGWKVEVANYEGVYPHSHTKFMVIDGKNVVGAGFNFGYLHYPFDHPSNKGGDLYDLGLVMSGPIAQQALVTFDDYWQGANQLHCPELSPDPGLLWNRYCIRSKAQASHVPEVKKYYIPDDGSGLSNAFSLNRNINYKESDDVILAALSSARETLDILEVNFSLKLICALDLLNDNVCSFDDALDYMNAILNSVEQNQTRVRVLVEKINSNGMENRISAKEFTRELELRGLDQFVEIRLFEGRMHAKAFLVDDEVLFIGSQNFHYSAWGETGLAEYNLATDDPNAVTTFKSIFDYYWEIGIPWEEY